MHAHIYTYNLELQIPVALAATYPLALGQRWMILSPSWGPKALEKPTYALGLSDVTARVV